MKIRPLNLEGCYEILTEPKGDERGYFMRTYDINIFREYGLVTEWVQENQSRSRRKSIIRGLHFQWPPFCETKLVRVVAGAVLDMFVDIRRGSKTYGMWGSLELSGEKSNMVYIPRGFAHGFCTLTEEALVLYKVDNFYSPAHEDGIRWDDETLKIPWPAKEPFLSPKDKALGAIIDFDSPF